MPNANTQKQDQTAAVQAMRAALENIDTALPISSIAGADRKVLAGVCEARNGMREAINEATRQVN
jgi:hypothetical protein